MKASEITYGYTVDETKRIIQAAVTLLAVAFITVTAIIAITGVYANPNHMGHRGGYPPSTYIYHNNFREISTNKTTNSANVWSLNEKGNYWADYH